MSRIPSSVSFRSKPHSSFTAAAISFLCFIMFSFIFIRIEILSDLVLSCHCFWACFALFIAESMSSELVGVNLAIISSVAGFIDSIIIFKLCKYL